MPSWLIIVIIGISCFFTWHAFEYRVPIFEYWADTPPKFNIAPEKLSSQKESSLSKLRFQGLSSSLGRVSYGNAFEGRNPAPPRMYRTLLNRIPSTGDRRISDPSTVFLVVLRNTSAGCNNSTFHVGRYTNPITGCWFQISLVWTPIFWKIPILTNIFQMGWFNHQSHKSPWKK